MTTIHRLKSACTGFARKTNTIANKKLEIKALVEPLKQDKDTIVELMKSASLQSCEASGIVFEIKEAPKKPTLTSKVILQLLAEFHNNDDDYQRFVQRLDQYRDTNVTTATTLKTRKAKDRPQAIGVAATDDDNDEDDGADDLDEIFN